MIRTQVLLTEEQQERIREIAGEEALSAGAVIRRLIDDALVLRERDRMRLAAERMKSYYTSDNTEDEAYRGVEPWGDDETG